MIDLIARSHEFLPREIFEPYADLDGAAAAAFLQRNGVEQIAHADLQTNGIASGYFERDGKRYMAKLSTNGFLVVLEMGPAKVAKAPEREEDDLDWDMESERNADRSYSDDPANWGMEF
jgi:hypothetical protein